MFFSLICKPLLCDKGSHLIFHIITILLYLSNCVITLLLQYEDQLNRFNPRSINTPLTHIVSPSLLIFTYVRRDSWEIFRQGRDPM